MEPPKPPAAETPPEDPGDKTIVQEQVVTAAAVVTVQDSITSLPAFGKRSSFRNIARSLSPEELCHPGVVKLTIENLDRAEDECEELRSYIDRFHEADVERQVLREKLKPNRATDVAFAVFIGVGCAIIGLAQGFWSTAHFGPIGLVVGGLLVAGGVAVRLIKQ